MIQNQPKYHTCSNFEEVRNHVAQVFEACSLSVRHQILIMLALLLRLLFLWASTSVSVVFPCPVLTLVGVGVAVAVAVAGCILTLFKQLRGARRIHYVHDGELLWNVQPSTDYRRRQPEGLPLRQ